MARLVDNNLFRIRERYNHYKKSTLPRYKIELVGTQDYEVKERFIYFKKANAFKKFMEICKNIPSKQYVIFTYHYCKLDLSGKWIASASRSEGIVWSSELGLHINKLKLHLEIDK